MMTGFTVLAPATVANVGPGFDALAFALEWHNEIHVEAGPSLEVTVEGEGAGAVELGAGNLVVRGIERVLGTRPRARVHLVNRIPFGRGFGSSAAAIVGGLVAGSALVGEEPDPLDHLDAAVEMEGHADNVTACLLGGFTVSLPGTRPAVMPMPGAWRAVVAVAPRPLATHAARAALPSSLPFGDAASTLARAARLVAAVAAGEEEALLPATDDCLHQPARFGLAPDAGSLVATLRAGGYAAFLSGAGPSVAALVPAHRAAEAEATARRSAPEGWEVRGVPFAARGARVVVSD